MPTHRAADRPGAASKLGILHNKTGTANTEATRNLAAIEQPHSCRNSVIRSTVASPDQASDFTDVMVVMMQIVRRDRAEYGAIPLLPIEFLNCFPLVNARFRQCRGQIL